MTIKQILKTITNDEWLWVALISVLLMVVIIFPVVFAYFKTPAQFHYTGMTIIGEGDDSVYFSYINQIKAGKILLQDFYTSEPQTGGVFNIFWLLVGWGARIFNLPAWIAFHLAQLVVIPIFTAIFYIFAGYIFNEKNLRRWSLVFACFASGLGGYYALWSQHGWEAAYKWLEFKEPLDIWVTESNIFFSSYVNPHFVLSLALMVLFWLLLLLAFQNNNYKYSLAAGLVGLIWFNFHPYYAPYVLAIGLVYTLVMAWRHKKLELVWHFLLAIMISFISVGYHYYLDWYDPVIGIRTLQNVTLTPPLEYVALGFGFFLPLSIMGLLYLAKKKYPLPDAWILLLVWLVVGLNLLYAPITFNRRFSEGLEIPMIFLTVYGLAQLFAYLKSKPGIISRILRNRALWLVLFAALFCFSDIFIFSRDLYFIAQKRFTFYYSDQLIQAIGYLAGQHPGQAILAHEAIAHYLPGLINKPVFIGHGHETIHYSAKKVMAADFYNNRYSPDQAWKFLKQNNIGYIFYSWWERGIPLNLARQPYLERIFANNQFIIYKVK